MEMCYDGALVMPSSYAVMDQDEMTYVDGGFYIPRKTVDFVVHSVMALVGGGIAKKFWSAGSIKAGFIAVGRSLRTIFTTLCGFGGAFVSLLIGLGIGMIGCTFAIAYTHDKGIDVSIFGGIKIK